MTRKLARALLFAVLLGGAEPVVAQLNFDSPLAESGVYRIIRYGQDGKPTGTGSGFLINSDGIVVTNYHVTYNHSRMLVAQEAPDVIRVWEAKVINSSPDKDISLLRVPGIKGTPCRLAKELPEKGNPAWAVGFPGFADDGQEELAFHRELHRAGYKDIPLNDAYNNYVSASVKAGNIEDIRKIRWGYPSRQFRLTAIAHSASISGGNSGGPLFDQKIQVIGINTIRKLDTKDGDRIMYSSAVGALIDMLDDKGIAYNEGGTSGKSITAPESNGSDQTEDPAPEPAETKEDSNKGNHAPLVVLPAADPVKLVPIAIFTIAGMLGIVAIAVALRRPRPQLRTQFVDTPPQAATPARTPPTTPTQPDKATPRISGSRGSSAPPPPPPPPPPKPQRPSLLITLSGSTSDGSRISERLRSNEFKRGGLKVGRDRKSCRVHIPDDSVSRTHIELRLTDGGKTFSVVDLGSANGTGLNGSKLPRRAQTELRDGDTVEIGTVRLQISISSSTT